MRALPTFLAAGLLLVALPALAQEAQTSFTLVAEFEGGEYVWTSEGASGTNPTLTVPPNQEITITIRQGQSSDGVPHNIQVGGAETSELITAAGDSLTYTFQSPPSGTVDYVCTIHPTTMQGTISVQDNTAEPADGNEGGGNGTPGFGLALVGAALVTASLALRRRG